MWQCVLQSGQHYFFVCVLICWLSSFISGNKSNKASRIFYFFGVCMAEKVVEEKKMMRSSCPYWTISFGDVARVFVQCWIYLFGFF